MGGGTGWGARVDSTTEGDEPEEKKTTATTERTTATAEAATHEPGDLEPAELVAWAAEAIFRWVIFRVDGVPD